MKNKKEHVSQLVEIIQEYRGGSEKNSMACLKAVRAARANGANANMPEREMNYTPLMTAAERWGFGEVIRTLLAHGADANKWDVLGYTALERAISSEDADNVRILLEGGANVNQPGVLNRVASESENREILPILIENGADVNMRDIVGDTPLHKAVIRCRYEDMWQLLKAGADPNARNKRGESPMSLAQSRNDTEALALLTATREEIMHRADIANAPSLRSILLKHNHYGDPVSNPFNIDNPNHDACLAELQEALAAGAEREVHSKDCSIIGLAIRLGYRSDIIKLLIDAGADVNAENRYGYKPLVWLMPYYVLPDSLYHDRDVREIEDIAQLLIDAGADITACSKPRCTTVRPFLHHACLHISAKLVRMLLDAGAEVNERDKQGRTPLMYAAKKSDADIVTVLLKAGADVNARDAEGNTAFIYASGGNHANEIMPILLAAGADPYAVNNAGDRNALIMAARERKCKRCDDFRYLLSLGMDVNMHDAATGGTPLIHAAQVSDNERAITALLAAGADVNARDVQNRTPLMFAAQADDNEKAISVLLAAGADVNACDAQGRTSLMYATVANDNEDTVRTLLAAGADMNARDARGRTPLMYAAQEDDNEETVRTLLAAGADVNARDNEGFTPLMITAPWYYVDNVRQMLKYGADVNACSVKGQTALSLAVGNNRVGIVLVLLQSGADVNTKDAEGKTALDIASAAGYEEIEALLKEYNK